jgi:DNA-directed RNA polymerase subunit RPC12/RpoP
MEDIIKCPKCGSSQLSANKKGFSGGKAAAGFVLTGGVGLLAGTIGSNKVVITCLKCGKQFKAGEYNKEKEKYDREREIASKVTKGEESFAGAIILFFIFSLLGVFMSYKLFSSDWDMLGVIFAIVTLICVIITIFAIYSEATRNRQQNKSVQQIKKRKNKIANKQKSNGPEPPPHKLNKKIIDSEIRNYLKQDLYLAAIDYCRINTDSTYEEAKNYVDLLASKMNE